MDNFPFEISQNNFPYNAPLGKNNVQSIYLLHTDRAYYKDIIVPMIANMYGITQMGNLLYEDALYGLVDESYNIIVPFTPFLKEIKSADENKKYAMDFVADAFNEMNAYLYGAALTGKISRDSPFLNLKAYNNYIDISIVIKEAQQKIASDFENYCSKDRALYSSITDEISFNKKYIDYIKNQIKNGTAITKGNIVLSTNYFNYISGLVIDIAKDKADNDTIKFNKYLSSPDFICFADACKRFGFKIDTNVPWRIYADLASPAMLGTTGNHIGYLSRYGIGNLTSLFTARYSKVYSDEILHVKNFFYNSYLTFFERNKYYEIDYKKITSCDITKGITKQRNIMTREQYFAAFPDTYWLRLYVYFKNYETKRGFKQQEFENIVREANNYVKVNKEFDALLYINNYFKQFKNVYYLSYLQNRRKKVETKAQNSGIVDIIF